MGIKGVYIHIPFCSYKCPYCDFTSLVSSPMGYKEYVEVLIREAELYRELDTDLGSVYFGGGTPTLLGEEHLGNILEVVDRLFGITSRTEITVEANPENLTSRKAKELKNLGVNRLSLGAQSFSTKGLKALGRKHSVDDTLRAYSFAREAGIENVNLDLIYAYSGQKPEDIELELSYIEKLRPEHVSAYMLTPYEGTPLGLEVKKGNVDLPREEELEEIYHKLWRGLKNLGYKRYEISNWSLMGKECRHNLLYWTMKEFLGLGVSAWGFFEKKRYANTKNIVSYAKKVLEGGKPIERVISLSEEELFEESLMLRLRLRLGLDGKERKLIPPHLTEFFEEDKGRLGIREEFMLLANEIIAEVLVYNSHRKALEVRNG